MTRTIPRGLKARPIIVVGGKPGFHGPAHGWAGPSALGFSSVALPGRCPGLGWYGPLARQRGKQWIKSFVLFPKSLPLLASAMMAVAATADAAVFTSMSQYENSKALAANPMYRWAAAVQRTDAANGTTYASAVMIAPDLLITAGHVTPRDNSLTAKLNEIVFGANYHTSTERYEISRTQRYPGYVFDDPSTIDLGVGWTTNFVQGYTASTVFSTAIFNDAILTVAEYGNYG